MIAHIRLTDAGFLVELEDGRTLEHAELRELASGLFAMGITADDGRCGDWREGDHILMSGQQIALKVALRRLGCQYFGPADDDDDDDDDDFS
jgi:hypothetical protein